MKGKWEGLFLVLLFCCQVMALIILFNPKDRHGPGKPHDCKTDYEPISGRSIGKKEKDCGFF